jgi:hypothetical protein
VAGGGRVCHGGGRCLGCWGRGILDLGDRAFPGGLGDGHGREVGFQHRQDSAYQADVLLVHLVVFCRLLWDDGDWLRFCEAVVGDRLGGYTKMSLLKMPFLGVMRSIWLPIVKSKKEIIYD